MIPHNNTSSKHTDLQLKLLSMATRLDNHRLGKEYKQHEKDRDLLLEVIKELDNCRVHTGPLYMAGE